MLNIFVRSIIIYFFLLVAMRLMGKRQLGELQPFEFAITLVASELACIPMSDPTIPIIYGIIPVFTLFIVHILITKLASKSIRFRRVLNGKPVVVIKQGNVLPDVMKELNMDTDDLMEALRGKDVFSPAEVEYAIIETNGGVTVLPKSQTRPLTPQDVGLEVAPATMPITIILEGKFLGNNLALTDGLTKGNIVKLLDQLNLESKDVMLMLLQGDEVFVQPYNSNSLTTSIKEVCP
jgi:uncharacterized membrane protein YcaP (DUF421 family)